MAIPKIDYPTYEVRLPSDDRLITVRPFSVKEEKLLLLAIEANNLDDVIKTVKQVINNCVLVGDVNIEKLPFFDIDFLFIFLRAKSIGENVDVSMTCNNVLEDGNTCNKIFTTQMDVSNIEIDRPEGIKDEVSLSDVVGVKMKYPNYASMKRMEDSELDAKSTMIANAIDYIWDENGKHSSKESSKEELLEFVESLTERDYKKLEEFVDNTPKFVVKLEAKCPKCGFDHKVRYSDFYDFFT